MHLWVYWPQTKGTDTRHSLVAHCPMSHCNWACLAVGFQFFTHFPGWEGFGGPLMLIPGGLLWNKRRPMAELAPGLSNGPYKLVWRHLTQTIPDTLTLTHVCIIAHAVFWGHLAPHASFPCEVRSKSVTMVACIAHFTWTNDLNMWPLTAWPPPKI